MQQIHGYDFGNVEGSPVTLDELHDLLSAVG